MASTGTGWALSDALEAVEAASPVDAVEAVTARLARAVGSERVSFLIADLAGRALVRLGRADRPGVDLRRDGEESAQEVPLSDETVAGVLSGQRAATIPAAGGWRVLAPVTQRGEVVGLLEVLMRTEPDGDAVRLVQRAAHLLAFVVIANRRHTDLFEWGQRTTSFELSAEIQRRLLPGSFTCEAGQFTLSAWLEPAATVGGDTYDYSLERDTLHLSVTDAMGHGVSSALTASLAVGSLRNSRRAGASIIEQAALTDTAMRTHASTSFVTGLLGRVDLRSGVLSLVNAGHVPPLLIRGDTITALELPIDRPFGLYAGHTYRSTDVALEAGDRFVIVTDGLLENRAAALPLRSLLELTRHLHPREATRHLADTILEVTGSDLADDATVLMLDWHDARQRERDSRAGADHR